MGKYVSGCVRVNGAEWAWMVFGGREFSESAKNGSVGADVFFFLGFEASNKKGSQFFFRHPPPDAQ